MRSVSPSPARRFSLTRRLAWRRAAAREPSARPVRLPPQTAVDPEAKGASMNVSAEETLVQAPRRHRRRAGRGAGPGGRRRHRRVRRGARRRGASALTPPSRPAATAPDPAKLLPGETTAVTAPTPRPARAATRACRAPRRRHERRRRAARPDALPRADGRHDALRRQGPGAERGRQDHGPRRRGTRLRAAELPHERRRRAEAVGDHHPARAGAELPGGDPPHRRSSARSRRSRPEPRT